MLNRLTHLVRAFTRDAAWKIHGFALGTTVALSTVVLGQGCAASGT